MDHFLEQLQGPMALLQTRLGSTTRLSLKGLLVSKVSTSNVIHLIPESDTSLFATSEPDPIGRKEKNH